MNEAAKENPRELSSIKQRIPSNIGAEMHKWATDLFPICRSITGRGTRQTLEYLQSIVPCLDLKAIPTGCQVFDWAIPNEWTVREAYVADQTGRRIIDFARNNLHLVGYSVPFQGTLELAQLEPHLHSLPKQPEAIPYITSYYEPRWGFCLTDQERRKLRPGHYKVVVDTELTPGVLNYGEAILPGRESAEVFLSTYVCHPSMANNELSGPVVTTALLRWLASRPDRRLSYRVVFIPETIGALTYLSQHHATMRANVIAGFNLTCVGDERAVSFLPSRLGNTLADRVALHVLRHSGGNFRRYTFLERGSDERQYCSPGIDLPVVSIMRSKYGTYPEYHTSLDNLSLVTPSGLKKSFELHTECIDALEANQMFVAKCKGEPQLGRRGLYPTLSRTGSTASAQSILDFFTYCDGQHDVLAIAEIMGCRVPEVALIAQQLLAHGLIQLAHPEP